MVRSVILRVGILPAEQQRGGWSRARLKRRQWRWGTGCRSRLLSPFDRAAVICYRATAASINFWHIRHGALAAALTFHLRAFNFTHSDYGLRESDGDTWNIWMYVIFMSSTPHTESPESDKGNCYSTWKTNAVHSTERLLWPWLLLQIYRYRNFRTIGRTWI